MHERGGCWSRVVVAVAVEGVVAVGVAVEGVGAAGGAVEVAVLIRGTIVVVAVTVMVLPAVVGTRFLYSESPV